jgi:acylphosphatase
LALSGVFEPGNGAERGSVVIGRDVSWRTARIMKRSRMHIFYSGRVQGVGFRYTVKSVAAGFELTGTVRNMLDGRVELVAEGPREELEAFQQAIRDSGLEHFVRDEALTWSEAKNEFRGFEIVR